MKPNSERLKTRLAARHVGALRNAVSDSVKDVDGLVEQWVHSHPADVAVSTQTARDWTKAHARTDDTALDATLGRVYADGWTLGVDLTTYQLAKYTLRRKAVSREAMANALVTDWNTWTPGNQAASNLLRPPGGLQRLLDKRDVTIKELNSTSLNRIGTILANGLSAGSTPREMAKDINEMLDDPSRALMISQTETSSAVVQASLDLYRESGVEMVEWLVADPCDECAENEAQSPISIGEDWINGDPPVHPNCMCDIAPYVVDTQGIFND